MWEVKWGWKCSLPSGLIRKGAGLSCITSELALHSSSLTRRTEDESRALTFTPVLPVLWKTNGPGFSPTAVGGATTLHKKKVKNCDLLSVSRKLYSTYFSPIIIPKYFSAHAYLLASLCLLVFTMNFWPSVCRLDMLMNVFHFLGMFSNIIFIILNVELTSATLVNQK